jgi:hypothetical protein
MKHEKAVRDGLLAVFTRPTPVMRNGTQPVIISEGSAFHLRSVEVVKPGQLKLCGVKGAGFVIVRTVDVQVFTGRLPDWRLDVYLDSIGYQAEVFHGVQGRHVSCRDHGGKHSVRKRLKALDAGGEELIKAFHRQF